METQSVWGMYIVWYLFLAGAGAGSYVLGVASRFLGIKCASTTKVCVSVAAPLVLIGTILLILDLGQPANVLNLYLTPNPTSMIALGTIVITVFMIVGAIHIALGVWPWKVLDNHSGATHVIEAVGLVLAFATAIYTGVLLGVIKSVPFWNNSLLPIVFVTSAFSAGAGTLVLGLVLVRTRTHVEEEKTHISESLFSVARADLVLLAAEVVAVFCYLVVIPGSSLEASASVDILTTGKLATVFWGGLVVAGLGLPLSLESVGHLREGALTKSARTALYILSGLFVLAGGVILRYLILAAGVSVA